MGIRAAFFQSVTTLSRPQKKAVLLIVDTALPPIFAMIVIFAPSHTPNLQAVGLVVLMSALAALTSILLGMPRIKLNAYGRHALGVTSKFTAISVLGYLIFSQVIGNRVDLYLVAKFGVVLFLGCVGCRYLMLTILLWGLRQGQQIQRVLIYGAGDTGVQMALALRYNPRIQAVAFVDDDPALQKLTIAGLQVLSPARLEMAVFGLSIDKVVLALPSASGNRIAQITRMIVSFGLDVQQIGSLGGRASASCAVTETPPRGFLERCTLTGVIPDIGTAYQGRVILVSGAGGSVGSELCRQLIALKPKALILYERSEIALYSIDRELRNLADHAETEIIPVLGSVTDAKLSLSTMVGTRTEVVFHAAAYKHLPLIELNPVAGLANNVLGTQVFAQAAHSAGVAQFILISTDKAVRPTSVMGASKRFAELVVRDFASKPSATQFSTVRFGNVLGSSGSVLPLFRDQIQKGGPITLTHDEVTRYFMTISEAARLLLISGTFPSITSGSNIYVLDMGKPLKIRTLAERMILAQGLSLKTEENPTGDIEIVITGLRSGEKLHEDMLHDSAMLPTPHAKILRTHEARDFAPPITAALRAADEAVRSGDQRAARAVLEEWINISVPTGVLTSDAPDMRQAMSFA